MSISIIETVPIGTRETCISNTETSICIIEPSISTKQTATDTIKLLVVL